MSDHQHKHGRHLLGGASLALALLATVGAGPAGAVAYQPHTAGTSGAAPTAATTDGQASTTDGQASPELALALTTPKLPQGVPDGTKVLEPPNVSGVAPLPGPVATPARLNPNMGILDVTPDEGITGTPVKVTGTHLPANTSIELTWSTSNVTWLVQPEPDTVNYLGRDSSDFSVIIGRATTDAQGAFSYNFDAPADFGGVHDIYAVAKGQADAHGGFLIERTVTVKPTSGPVGTPITVTYTGLGSSFYPGGASLLYDNHYVGEMMANWTRGTARAVIRAAGPPGRHVIQIGDAISFLYLNIAQSPLPYATGATAIFTVTRDSGPPPPSVDWPNAVTPTLNAYTTLAASGLAVHSKVQARLSTTSGPVGTQVSVNASGLASSDPVQLVWSTVVGSRVDCTSICWAYASTTLGTQAPTDANLHASLTVPDGLGGWHVVQLVQDGKIVAQVPFYVKESLVGPGVSSVVVKQGQTFTVHLKGVGWTQLDNTVAVDYDNSYIGYGCGFNSNGDVQLSLRATGGPGTHLIDIYPMLYTESPSFANTPYGMVPILTYASDEPALALGYQLPAIRLAIEVVK